MQNKKNLIIFLLALIGFFIALYLTKQYLANQTVICLTGGCEKVRLSPLSKILGLPVPLYGLAGYLSILILAFLRTLNVELRTRLLKPIFYIALGGLAFSLYNNLVDWFFIKTFCEYCFGCLLIMIGLVVVSKSEMTQPSTNPA